MKVVRGTNAAVVPILVPTIAFVTGRIKTKRIIKGTERTTLITEFKTKNTTLFFFIPPSLVRTSKNERISAKNEPIKRVNNSLIEYINRL